MAKTVIERPMFVDVPMFYDPEVDRQEVEQFGALDLKQAYLSGVIPGDLPNIEDSFSGASDPRTLMNRAMDVFEHMRQVEYVQGCLKGLTAEQRKGAEKALSAAESARTVTGEGPKPETTVTSGEN